MVWVTLTIILAALLALAGLFEFLGKRRDYARYPPPGHMLDIGGRRLHARVQGSGTPPVIFESGISATSVNWVVLQPQVAAFTKTCAYDRAGLGWSDPARGAFDATRMVRDLAALLDNLALPAPYVLVGHSFGGTLVRIFAERYPAKVAGLVLVDPVLQCEWAHPGPTDAAVHQRAIRIARWGAWGARLGLIRLATTSFVVTRFMVPAFGRKESGGKTQPRRERDRGVVDRLQTELVKLPPAMIPVIRSHWCRAKNFPAMVRHLRQLQPSFREVRGSRLDCPVIVISGANNSPEGLAEHRAIAALSPAGEHIMAQHSGHWVQFDEPQLVVDAIRRVVLR